jgi:hypothetical protein
VDSVAEPLIASPEFAESGPALSPDGRWLAYSSDRTEQDEVYVVPFPDVDSSRVAVSEGGGWNPQWSHSGDELFYLDAARRLMAAQVETDPDFRVVSTDTLFIPSPDLYVPSDPHDDFYDVRGDDQAFLMARTLGGVFGAHLEVVQNFFEELRQLVPN